MLEATVTSHAPPHAMEIVGSGAKQLWRKEYFKESVTLEELLIGTVKQILKELKIPKEKVSSPLDRFYSSPHNTDDDTVEHR